MIKLASVDRRFCTACGVCEKNCPREAIRVWQGSHAQVEEAECIGCGLCVRTCPAACIRLREAEAGHTE